MKRLWLLALVSCGDGLTEAGYRGEPLHTFTGQVTTVSGVTTSAPLRAAVFWNPRGQTDLGEDLVEQDAVSVAVRFPGVFEVNVFEPPPEDVAWVDRGASHRVGLLLVYEDLNGSGRADSGELRGGATHQVLLYARRALKAAESPSGAPLGAGYHALRVPLPCEVEEADELAADTSCGVPIGDPCGADTDCGTGGLCLLRDPSQPSWPGGYCVQPVTPDCRPSGVKASGEAGEYWLRRCEEPEHCRLADGYTCAEGACVPATPSALVLSPDFAVAPLCVEHAEGHEED